MSLLLEDGRKFILKEGLIQSIGSDPSCHFPLDHPSLSVKHAQFHVEGPFTFLECLAGPNTVFLSRSEEINEKSGRFSLLPQKCYQILDGNVIMLGNLTLKYRDSDSAHSKASNLSISSSNSNASIQKSQENEEKDLIWDSATLGTDEGDILEVFDKVSKENDEKKVEKVESNGSNDPTQLYSEENESKSNEDPSKARVRKRNRASVGFQEEATQFYDPNESISNQNNSNSSSKSLKTEELATQLNGKERDEKEEKIWDLPTQENEEKVEEATQMYETIDSNKKTKREVDSTQLYEFDSKSSESFNAKSHGGFEEATQFYGEESAKKVREEEATQLYGEENEEKQKREELPTQLYDNIDGNDNTSNGFKIPSAKFTSPRKKKIEFEVDDATQLYENEDSIVSKKKEEELPTQLYEDSNAEVGRRRVNVGEEATQMYTVNNDEATQNYGVDSIKNEKRCEEEATQIYHSEPPKRAFNRHEEATQLYEDLNEKSEGKSKKIEEMATQLYDSDDLNRKKKENNDESTQMYETGSSFKVPPRRFANLQRKNMSFEMEELDATQTYEENSIVSDKRRESPVALAEDATLAYGDDSNVNRNVEEEATQTYDASKFNQKNQISDSNYEAPTQIYEENVVEKRKERVENNNKMMDATQAYDASFDEPTQSSQENSPLFPLQKVATINPSKNEEKNEEKKEEKKDSSEDEIEDSKFVFQRVSSRESIEEEKKEEEKKEEDTVNQTLEESPKRSQSLNPSQQSEGASVEDVSPNKSLSPLGRGRGVNRGKRGAPRGRGISRRGRGNALSSSLGDEEEEVKSEEKKEKVSKEEIIEEKKEEIIKEESNEKIEAEEQSWTPKRGRRSASETMEKQEENELEVSTPKRKTRNSKEEESPSSTPTNKRTRSAPIRFSSPSKVEEEEEELVSTPSKRAKSLGMKPNSSQENSQDTSPHKRGSKSSQPQSHNQQPIVMFTGVLERAEEVQRLGGRVTNSMKEECTHIITLEKIKRTIKFMWALCAGAKFVNMKWLEASEHAKHFVDEEKFKIHDAAAEKQWSFSLEESCKLARERKMMKDWSIFISPSTKPSPLEFEDVINMAGGKLLKKAPGKLDDKTLIVSCEDDVEVAKKLMEKGYVIYTNELLLSGIFQQKWEFGSHILLDPQHPEEMGSTKRIRKKT
eukprot:TRINITY_DN2279_c0_g1_i1.p1 TRINITY_DN2279_c0_g1~~TRINITY_DN2279_c0_g1_i1.p1  ORF type:complete len:1166 (-),score=527.70 TRINITY_DN2279_c0_g1_i1:48-3545(-)